MSDIAKLVGRERFKWRSGETIAGVQYEEMYDSEAHCDRCSPVGGFSENMGFYEPWHYRKSYATRDEARQAVIKYVSRKLTSDAEMLKKAADDLLRA